LPIGSALLNNLTKLLSAANWRCATRNVIQVSNLKTVEYLQVFSCVIKHSLYVLVPFIVLIFFLEVAFDFFEGNSIKVFFTIDFIIHFLLHQLMFILYVIVFLLSLLINIVRFKYSNSRKQTNKYISTNK